MINDIKLTNLTKSSGCAAKIGPATLESVLKNLPKFNDNNLIVGFDKKDDACVYKIGDENVLIQTVDFFPPMVDDPYIFGQIAATNALSDIYAMGGDPAIAMNLLCFPSCLDKSIMSEILSGGYNKVQEAGAIVVGDTLLLILYLSMVFVLVDLLIKIKYLPIVILKLEMLLF